MNRMLRTICFSILTNISISPFNLRFTFDNVGKDKEVKMG